MSTRACIARMVGKSNTPFQFEGVYHHWDGYPSELGRNLFVFRNGFFHGNTSKMLKFLIDQHPAGWSTIIGTNLRIKPGFMTTPYKAEMTKKDREKYERYLQTPQCYCHGERHGDPNPISDTIAFDMGCQYVYVFSRDGNTMYVLSGNEQDKQEIKRTEIWHPSYSNFKYIMIGQIDLNGIAPTEDEWSKLPIYQPQANQSETKSEAKSYKSIEEEEAFRKSELAELLS